ncbi:MAG: Tat pathway signal protein [Bacteroidales bacterium]|nr:Tat pathway signal protein [Bacteroidales bacterium]
MKRRKFIKLSATAGIAASMPSVVFSQKKRRKIVSSGSSKLIWANLLHLSTNMWEDHPYIKKNRMWPDIIDEEIHKVDYECKTCKDAIAWGLRAYRPFLVFEESVWNTVLNKMSDAGMNMVVIDLGDGVKYESHPEIAVRNAWSVDKLRSELSKIRNLGMEPIPKLNFATSHDTWLGEYSKIVSTSKYYSVCRDLIQEVIEIFDNPRFFHLGMDEETYGHQRNYNHIVIRQNDLWWYDFYFLVNEVEKKGVRSWIWSDYGWRHPELFFKKMPKSVLQSNWYYQNVFDLAQLEKPVKTYVQFYNDLENYGYDQVPTGSNWSYDTNMENTVDYCKKNIDPSRLYGFMTAPWAPTLSTCLDTHIEAVNQVNRAIKKTKR